MVVGIGRGRLPFARRRVHRDQVGKVVDRLLEQRNRSISGVVSPRRAALVVRLHEAARDFGNDSTRYGNEIVERRTAIARWLGGAPSESAGSEQWLKALHKAFADIANENRVEQTNWRQRARKYAAMLREGRDLTYGQFLTRFEINREEARARSGVDSLMRLSDAQFKRMWGITKDEYRKMTGLDEGDASDGAHLPPPPPTPADDLFSAPRRLDEQAAFDKVAGDDAIRHLPVKARANIRALREAAAEVDRRGGASDGGERPASDARDVGALLQWAREKGRLIPEAEFVRLGRPMSNATSEHEVWQSSDGESVMKRTWAGFYGQVPSPESGKLGRKTATPADYLRRMALQNAVFGSEIRLQGVTTSEKPSLIIGAPSGEPSFVVSQGFITPADLRFPHPSDAQIASFMESHGFKPAPKSYFGWWRPDGVVIVDAKPDNFILSERGVEPIDLQMAVFTPEQMRQAGLYSGAGTDDLFSAPRRRVAPGVKSPLDADPSLRERIAKSIGTHEDNRPLTTRLRDWWQNLVAEGKRRAKQGIFDSFHSILDLEQSSQGRRPWMPPSPSTKHRFAPRISLKWRTASRSTRPRLKRSALRRRPSRVRTTCSTSPCTATGPS